MKATTLPLAAMIVRLATLALALAAPVATQRPEPTSPTLAHVLEVVDAESLDVPAYEALIRLGEPAAAPLAAAYATPIGDEERRARRRARVLRALRALGPDAAVAGPTLIEFLGDADRDDVPALLGVLAETAALGDEPDGLYGDAARAWAPFTRPGDREFILRLKGAIRLHVRMTQPLPHDDVDTLISALEDDDPYRRELAAELLGRLGPGTRRALPALEDAATTADHPRRARLPNHSLSTDFVPMIRRAAQIAIARIAPDDPRAIDGLRELLEADDPGERIEAAMAIGRLDEAGTRAAPDLVKALGDEDVRLVAEAVTALGMVDADSPRTIHALRRLLQHADPAIAARARATLRRFGVEPADRRQSPGGASKGTDTKR